jgi:hypothetical protein
LIYEEQLTVQRERARLLRGFTDGRLALVKVEYPDAPVRVSIIGHAISWGALEVWSERYGATVTVIEEI